MESGRRMKWPEIAPDGSKATEATPSIVSPASPSSTACCASAGAGWWFPFACESETKPIAPPAPNTDCATYRQRFIPSLFVYQAQETDTTGGGRDDALASSDDSEAIIPSVD
jgi:hypothetical protein